MKYECIRFQPLCLSSYEHHIPLMAFLGTGCAFFSSALVFSTLGIWNRCVPYFPQQNIIMMSLPCYPGRWWPTPRSRCNYPWWIQGHWCFPILAHRVWKLSMCFEVNPVLMLNEHIITTSTLVVRTCLLDVIGATQAWRVLRQSCRLQRWRGCLHPLMQGFPFWLGRVEPRLKCMVPHGQMAGKFGLKKISPFE